MNRIPALLFLIIVNVTTAQENLIFRDDFSDNNYNWPIKKNQHYELAIVDGTYQISLTKNLGDLVVLHPLFINQAKDFIIECKFSHTFTKKGGFGLIWGSEDTNNYFAFELSHKNDFAIQESKDGKTKTIIKNGKTKYLKPKGVSNQLKIKKNDQLLTFYVNDKKVTSLPFFKFTGRMIGFKITNKTEVEIDYITVKQEVNINFVENPINGYVLEHLGENINSEYHEIFPVISPDGETLYICRDSHPLNTEQSRQDIWYSDRLEDGTWSEIKNIGPPINNGANNSVISVVSADGNILLVKNVYNSDGSHKNDGISITQKTENSWSIPEPLVIEDFYNQSEYISMSLSIDRNFLILAVDRDDSYGGEDLYVCFRNGNTYTKPLNLGPVVNTSEDDFTPFIAADNTTLYYSTDGYDGYGSADIFITKRLDDSWTNWSIPKNLGPEINTINWDAYYTIPASGEFAYLVSSNNSIGKTDVFMIKQSEDAKPNPVALIFGKVINAKTKEPVQAEIVYRLMSSDSVIGKAMSDGQNGQYKIILPYNNAYSFYASKSGFYPISENINISNISEYIDLERDLYLSPIEKGDVIRLNNVFFDFDSAVLKEDSYFELKRLITVLQENPEMIIQIGGHTDSDGSDEYNQRLSQNRVNAIIVYLINNQIDSHRLTAIGYGELKPIATNETEEGKARNRRVEFTIIEK